MGRMMERKPSVWSFLVPGIIFVIGIMIGGILIVSGVKNLSGGEKTKIIVPGVHTFQVNEPGKYRIYTEDGNVIDGIYYGAPESVGRMSFKVYKDHEEIEVVPCKGSISYTVDGVVGVSTLEFEAAEVGEYQVDVDFEKDSGEKAVLAITKDELTIPRFVGTIIGSIFFIMMSLIVLIGGIGFGIYRTIKYNNNVKKTTV